MSSKRHIRSKVCSGKHRHASLGEAMAHVIALARTKGETGLTPYRCKFCGAYHVGHAPAHVKERI